MASTEQSANNAAENRVYLITGATGIAAATARLAARAGARLFMVSRSNEELTQLSDEIETQGGACRYACADLTVPASAREAMEKCVDEYGRIDALYNVVGISGRRFGDGPVHECSDEGWKVTLETNATSTFLMCRAVISQMLRQSPNAAGARGNILNMASVLAYAPEPNFFATHAYAASKGAIIGLSKAMAAYYAREKIRVNVIAPSLVRTPMSVRAQTNPDILELMKSKQPLAGDLIEAEDVARLSLFLLSDEARMMTGEVIAVDAGWGVS